MVIDVTGSVEGIYAFIYCIKWRSGQVLPMPHSLTHSLTTLKDRATQLLIKYKSGALVTQYVSMIRGNLHLLDHLLDFCIFVLKGVESFQKKQKY